MANPGSVERSAAEQRFQRGLIALAVLSLWSIVPPYLGPALGFELDVSGTVEAVDHLLPGVLGAAAALFAYTRARRGDTDGTAVLAALALCALAALFQAVSHFTLVLDAGDPDKPVATVAWHATPAPIMLALALWLFFTAPPSRATA